MRRPPHLHHEDSFRNSTLRPNPRDGDLYRVAARWLDGKHRRIRRHRYRVALLRISMGSSPAVTRNSVQCPRRPVHLRGYPVADEAHVDLEGSVSVDVLAECPAQLPHHPTLHEAALEAVGDHRRLSRNAGHIDPADEAV